VSWVKDAITALEAGELAQVRPHGGSMRGRIESGQLVTIAPVTADAVNRSARLLAASSKLVDFEPLFVCR
jgi:hypothetical protein